MIFMVGERKGCFGIVRKRGRSFVGNVLYVIGCGGKWKGGVYLGKVYLFYGYWEFFVVLEFGGLNL